MVSSIKSHLLNNFVRVASASSLTMIRDGHLNDRGGTINFDHVWNQDTIRVRLESGSYYGAVQDGPPAGVHRARLHSQAILEGARGSIPEESPGFSVEINFRIC